MVAFLAPFCRAFLLEPFCSVFLATFLVAAFLVAAFLVAGFFSSDFLAAALARFFLLEGFHFLVVLGNRPQQIHHRGPLGQHLQGQVGIEPWAAV